MNELCRARRKKTKSKATIIAEGNGKWKIIGAARAEISLLNLCRVVTIIAEGNGEWRMEPLPSPPREGREMRRNMISPLGRHSIGGVRKPP